MASVIEQFKDLFVFAYGKKCDLGLAMPKNWGRKNIMGGAYDKY